MSWQWTEGEELDDIEGTNTEVVQIYQGDLMDLVENQSDSYRKDLAIVTLPPYSKYRRANLKRSGLVILEKMRSKYSPGDIISIQDLIKFTASFGFREKETIYACNRLWGRGLLRKWAMGIWREGHLKRSMGKVGKHYGVHYELLEKT